MAVEGTQSLLVHCSQDLIDLVRSNISVVRKKVRKLVRQFDVFSENNDSQTISVPSPNGDVALRLRLSKTSEIVFTSVDFSKKESWAELPSLTLHIETGEPKPTNPVDTSLQLEQLSKKIDDVQHLLQEKLVDGAIKTSTPRGPRKTPASANASGKQVQPAKTPQIPKATPVSAPASAANVPKNPIKPSVSPAKPIQNSISTTTAPASVVKTPQTVTINAPSTKPAVVRAPAKPAAGPKRNSGSIYVPNFAAAKNMSGLGTTPQNNCLTNGVAANLPPPSSQAVTKRPHPPSPANASPAAKRVHREAVSDPVALKHLLEVIDSVVAGVEDPTDFAIEPASTRTALSPATTMVDEEEEFVQLVEAESTSQILPAVAETPKRKKKKKHHRSSSVAVAEASVVEV